MNNASCAPFQKHEEDIGVLHNVVHSGLQSTDLPSQQVVEYERKIFPGLTGLPHKNMNHTR